MSAIAPAAPEPAHPGASAEVPAGPLGAARSVTGALDCAREDLPLLPPEQRRNCEGRLAVNRSPGLGPAGGCAREVLARLTDADRAACETWLTRQHAFGADHRVDVIPAAKRAYYDAVQEAYREVRAANGAIPQHDAHLPSHGLNMNVGIHPKCRAGAPPRGAIKLGHCYIQLPRGFGTEEAGLPPP